MKKRILISAVLMLIISSVSFGEVVSRVMTYNGPGGQVDKCTGIVQDNLGRVYVTGISWGGTATKDDFATIKFGEDGDFLWVSRYDGPGHDLDYASAIAIDNAGNVYVTGWSRSGTSLGTEDYVTIKYNTSGQQVWVRRYDGAIGDCYYYDYARAIVVDAQGNVYVTGQSWGNDNLRDDYLTLKYNSSGVLQWAKRYNGPSCKEDIAYSLSLDGSGNVYVTGTSYMNNMGYDMLTVKYNSAGSQQWAARYNGPANSTDAASEVRSDLSGNVYITGCSYGGTMKLDYATIKYNTAGTQQWVKTFNGEANDTDCATSIDLDVYNNVYVTGYSKSPQVGTSPGKYDYYTIKYSNVDGAVLWQNKYDGGSTDKAWDIKVVNKSCAISGSQGDIPCWDIDVYITGESIGFAASSDFVTIRYTEFGVTKWTNRYNGPLNSSDAAYSISSNNGYPIIYAAGSFGNDYGIIGITEVRQRESSYSGISNSYPNPFNPETNISFKVAKESNVQLVIYDMLGRTVATLVDKKMGEGLHEVTWNASNLNSGVYLYRIKTDYATETKKLILVK